MVIKQILFHVNKIRKLFFFDSPKLFLRTNVVFFEFLFRNNSFFTDKPFSKRVLYNTSTIFTLMKIFLSLLLSTFCLSAFAEEETTYNPMREWTSADGTSTFKGKILKYEGKTVSITPVGKNNVSLPIDKLSEADRSWLEENKDQIGKEKDAEVSTVPTTEMGKQLAKTNPLFGKKINTGAKYYLVLFSASWCPPCRAEMPDVVKKYNKEIAKNADMELVHISRDGEADAAKEWAKKEKMTFPALKKSDFKNIPLIEANQPRGIPYMYLYNGEGELLHQGAPSEVLKVYKAKITGAKAGGKVGDKADDINEEKD